MEIERKWLVDPATMPPIVFSAATFGNNVNGLKNSSRVEQYYLNGADSEWVIRLRKADDKYFLTLKSKGLLSREELEFEITRNEFIEGIKQSKKSIKKQRHFFEFDGTTYEVDVYDDYYFITCEVEFSSEEEALAFTAPAWCTEDVTNDPYYKNVNLAK